MRKIIEGCIAASLAFQTCWAEEPEKKEQPAFTIHPIGTVEKEHGKVAVVIDSQYADALLQLDRYSHVWVIYWFDQNDTPEKRSTLRVHPRGNPDNPLTGVFACRSPHRPNLLALSLCKIRSLNGNRLEIETIDAFDNTPVIDLKPYVPAIDAATNVRTADWRAKAGKPK